MSAQGYYNNDQPQQGGQQYSHGENAQNQSRQQAANPYGYPESNAPQPYYGHNPQQGGYDQSQGHQSQPHGSYESQSYNYQQQQQQGYAPPPYNASSYPPYQSQDGYQQPPSHDQYAGAYDSSRQQGYGQYGQYGQSQYNQPPGVPPQEFKADPNAPAPAEGDRGLMGALAGGALGAYGGHQMGHGVIGALGGAFAGHKLEDAIKDKKKDKHHKHEDRHEDRMRRREERRQRRRERRGSRGRSSSSSSSSSSSDSDRDKKHRKHRGGHHGAYAGNFSSSASNITLDRDFDLIALCTDVNGKERLSSIDLNKYLSNEWGSFKWARGGNAFASAKNVKLVEGGKVLEADLGDGKGGWTRSRVILDERIKNDNGDLVYAD